MPKFKPGTRVRHVSTGDTGTVIVYYPESEDSTPVVWDFNPRISYPLTANLVEVPVRVTIYDPSIDTRRTEEFTTSRLAADRIVELIRSNPEFTYSARSSVWDEVEGV